MITKVRHSYYLLCVRWIYRKMGYRNIKFYSVDNHSPVKLGDFKYTMMCRYNHEKVALYVDWWDLYRLGVISPKLYKMNIR